MDVFFTLTLFAILFFPNDQLDPPDRSSVTMRYIDQFAALAVKEMQRTGIPASITLAQGIHESQSGQSLLARNANNHFGIKCKSYWPGPVYLHKDDDTDKRGNLIESCFRAYNSAVASYLDHSEFLKHRKYYRDLFSLSPTDYEAWARGLKKAGYATDPNYADILIRIIRKYELDTFDHLNLHTEIKTGTVLATLPITTLKQVESLTPPKQLSDFYRDKVR
jgi:flagellum-specific peptidoglycan hydrolase FlgJ